MPRGEGTRELIEGHPIGIRKIIEGDLREKTWTADGQTYTNINSDGVLLYDSQDKHDRPWFVLVYESGKRYID